MATLFEAIVGFGPRLTQGRTAAMEDLGTRPAPTAARSATAARIGLDDVGYKALWDAAWGTAVGATDHGDVGGRSR